jgi:hypothetical protein
MRPLQKSLPVFSWNLFERTVELGCLVDLLANFCGPNLAVLYQVACALDEMHGASGPSEVSHTGISCGCARMTSNNDDLEGALREN